MNAKEKLQALREQIDGIDTEMVSLLSKRMQISENIANVKAQGNIAILDSNRENEVIANALAVGDARYAAETQAFMRTLMSMSRLKQNETLQLANPVHFPASAPIATDEIQVAFQGVSGAWSEQSAAVLFPNAETRAMEYFEDVFHAVKNKEVHFGMLPIENSQTGAIGEVYDLLRRHACYIVGQVWISAAQCLLALPSAKLSDIREVYSHPQGFHQCRRFLKNKNWDLTACRNTAFAAQMVAEKNENRYAAIASRRAASVHGLSVLAPDIIDDMSNKTRFIAIADAPIYTPHSDITSITFSTAHKSGALCSVLQSFMLAGINLSRIESRPVSGDKYRFFIDLKGNIASSVMQDALQHAAMQCEYFEVLGCYSEISEDASGLFSSTI